ncbi:MAG TPA: hypothetical protein VIE88_02760 [Vicinamibacteria bacterium]
MRRREILLSLVGGYAIGAGTAGAQDLSSETVRQMMRTLARLEPMPGEEVAVMASLQSFRYALPSDPGVEPATTFDPESGK